MSRFQGLSDPRFFFCRLFFKGEFNKENKKTTTEITEMYLAIDRLIGFPLA